MNHLRPDTIDLLLEGATDPHETARMEEHLASCAACGTVRDERKAFLEAVGGLPDLEVPPDLAARIMARAFPRKPRLSGGLIALGGGSALLVLGGLAYVLATGGNLAGLLLGAGKSSWGAARDFSLALVKLTKLAVLSLTLLARFAGDIVEGMRRLGSMIPPEVYAAGLFIALAATAVCFLGLRRKFAHGERP
ncbi:MAG TPA: zf-HC2 domain-containing protein [Acidobacteriota bacterium]|nr:zf-HC2 domain-containing protein [Acidobacteriota bacterium]